MLGWNIGVYRQNDGGASPAKFPTPYGTRIAIWQAGLGGLDWLVKLVETGKAIDLGGNGYPNRYTASAENLIPEFIDSPPDVNENWVCGPDDIIGAGWEGKTVIDKAEVSLCRPGEWLLVVAWDES